MNQATTVCFFCSCPIYRAQDHPIVVAQFIGHKTIPIVVAQFIGRKAAPIVVARFIGLFKTLGNIKEGESRSPSFTCL